MIVKIRGDVNLQRNIIGRLHKETTLGVKVGTDKD